MTLSGGITTFGLFLAMLAALEIGFRGGRRLSLSDKAMPTLGVVQGALLGLVALLLGFTFALASERYDARRVLLAHEANAIGTTYLRTTFLPKESGKEARRLLRDYLEQRLKWLRAGGDAEELAAASQSMDELQIELWWTVQKEIVRAPESEALGLLADSLNECVGLEGLQQAARKAHVPQSVLGLVEVAACLAALSIGYGFGLTRERVFAAWVGFSTLVAATVFAIMDFDRPSTGMIRVSEYMIADLHERVVRAVDREKGE